jgi:hypothetical protein
LNLIRSRLGEQWHNQLEWLLAHDVTAGFGSEREAEFHGGREIRVSRAGVPRGLPIHSVVTLEFGTLDVRKENPFGDVRLSCCKNVPNDGAGQVSARPVPAWNGIMELIHDLLNIAPRIVIVQDARRCEHLQAPASTSVAGRVCPEVPGEGQRRAGAAGRKSAKQIPANDGEGLCDGHGGLDGRHCALTQMDGSVKYGSDASKHNRGDRESKEDFKQGKCAFRSAGS